MDPSKLSREELILELQTRLQENELLNQQLEQMDRSLLEVNKKLADSESLKSHFISNVTNEINNPFTSILALAENILNVDKEEWKKVISMVSLIHTEVFNLDFQLKNIFTAAKLEAGEIIPEISRVNISRLIDDLIESFKYEARHKNVKIKYINSNEASEDPMFFKTDAQKIYLLLCNLLSNAIKFSYDNGNIIITSKKENNTLILSVQDFGQGISKANTQIIFDRFRRIDSGINTIHRGHSLGLSVIKAIVDILEGKISFISKAKKGSTFTIIFPESDKESYGTSVNSGEILFNDEKL
ncbi:MAG: HAMP domain-containing histidine kinase [Bacteroidales bacterium]|nr:HAMP domain-containing histidine kinase [Bacteroidales bacterium]